MTGQDDFSPEALAEARRQLRRYIDKAAARVHIISATPVHRTTLFSEVQDPTSWNPSPTVGEAEAWPDGRKPHQWLETWTWP